MLTCISYIIVYQRKIQDMLKPKGWEGEGFAKN